MRILAIAAAVLIATVAASQDVSCPEGYVCTRSDTDSTVTTSGSMETTINQPPPSAISPQLGGNSNSDLCTIGVAGAVQTQILGISAGATFTEENCKRLKNAKTLYDMGMKVAAVSVMCQDPKVFDAMLHAGTPCPYNGQIGAEARLGWESHVESEIERSEDNSESNTNRAIWGMGALGALLLFF